MATKLGTFKMKVWGEHCQQREKMSRMGGLLARIRAAFG